MPPRRLIPSPAGQCRGENEHPTLPCALSFPAPDATARRQLRRPVIDARHTGCSVSHRLWVTSAALPATQGRNGPSGGPARGLRAWRRGGSEGDHEEFEVVYLALAQPAHDRLVRLADGVPPLACGLQAEMRREDRHEQDMVVVVGVALLGDEWLPMTSPSQIRIASAYQVSASLSVSSLQRAIARRVPRDPSVRSSERTTSTTIDLGLDALIEPTASASAAALSTWAWNTSWLAVLRPARTRRDQERSRCDGEDVSRRRAERSTVRVVEHGRGGELCQWEIVDTVSEEPRSPGPSHDLQSASQSAYDHPSAGSAT